MSGKCLANVWQMSGKCLANVWQMSGNNISKSKILEGIIVFLIKIFFITANMVTVFAFRNQKQNIGGNNFVFALLTIDKIIIFLLTA
jgi:hypothetical protein